MIEILKVLIKEYFNNSIKFNLEFDKESYLVLFTVIKVKRISNSNLIYLYLDKVFRKLLLSHE